MASIDRIFFLGSKKLGLDCLREMYRLRPEVLAGVVTIDDRNDSRTVFRQFQQFCEEAGLKLHVARTREETEALIQGYQPQLCMLISWYWLIGKSCLEHVPDGMMCLHNSLLPAYRGAAPLVWAIINGESHVGVSLFSISEGLDDGDLWAQTATPLASGDYIGDVLAKTEAAAVSLLAGSYCDILDRKLTPTRQNHSFATYGAFRKPSDGLIDWTQPAEKVFDFIRAQSEPYPGAYCFSGSARLTIWRAKRTPTRFFGAPGQVVRSCKDGVHVVCGDHEPLILLDVEIDGARIRPELAVRSTGIRLSGGASIVSVPKASSQQQNQCMPA